MRLDTAKSKSICDFLHRLGYPPAKIVKGESWYCSPLRDEQLPSFKISPDGKAWYDHGLGQGGNIIDFAQIYFKTTDFSTILAELDLLYNEDTRQKPLFPTLAQPKAQNTPLRAKEPTQDGSSSDKASFKPLGNNPALVRYLASRGIALEFAQPYLQEIYYRRSGKSYFALAFVNNVGGFELRNAYFKGNRGGKSISTIIQNHHAPGQVLLFEGFMDFLSYLSHNQQVQAPYPVIVLNGVAQVKLAIQEIQRLGAETVQVYADRDASGSEMFLNLQSGLANCEVQDCSWLYQSYDDFNAFVQAQAEQARHALQKHR